MPEPQGARIPAPRVHPPHAPKAMSNQQMIPDGLSDSDRAMQFVCDAPRGLAWFQIETEAEAALESDLMQHAVEKHFRQARIEAVKTYVLPSGSYIERDIGLKVHLQRVMPVFLTLRD